MKTLLLLAVIMAIAAVLPGLLQVHGDLLNFRKMIKLTTGKEPATRYSFYGCYCGMSGRGTPKDATDW
uniref:Phospholipase A2 n=1 Tax=Bos indicus x Bos taurus TaxID=30522 RepID=A0A4W2DAZ2_BOBOX